MKENEPATSYQLPATSYQLPATSYQLPATTEPERSGGSLHSHPHPSQHPHGFIAIVALWIFALLMVVGISLQMTVMDTYQSIKNNNNYLAARYFAESILEHAQFNLNSYEPGYNSGVVNCNFNNGQADNANHVFCSERNFLYIAGTKKVSIVMNIKGRPTQEEKIKTTKCKSSLTNFSNDCYVVPFPGTGDAGDQGGLGRSSGRCSMYKPFSEGSTDKVDADLTVGLAAQIDNLDYSCNWNKLTFGSGLTDRVAVPLFYDNGDGNMVSPFKQPGGTPDIAATKFLLKLRPPCLPCGKPDPNSGAIPEGTRVCAANQDPTVCENKDRYKLDVEFNAENEPINDDIVVQWQINGECVDTNGKVEQCGMIAIPKSPADKSAIFESRINKETFETTTYILIQNDTRAYDVNTSPLKEITMISSLDPQKPPKLPQMSKPILTLFLSKSLISNIKKNIPYLEYQVLTDEPIGNPKTRIGVIVTVDGNTFTRTLLKEEQKPLIDFAVHN